MRYTTRIIAHRGVSGEALENTAAAFRKAVELGVDVIETDVHLSADGHVVISHDDNFSRLGGPAVPINAASREEIAGYRLNNGSAEGGRPLFMDEALELFPEACFNVDLKDSGVPLVQAWAAMLPVKNTAQRCRTASFHDSSLRELKRLYPGCLTAPGRFGVMRLLAGAFLGRVRRPEADEGVLQIPPLFNRRMLSVLHRFGWEVEVWTINNSEEMERLIRMGVDGIMTDCPSLLKDVINKMNAEAASAADC